MRRLLLFCFFIIPFFSPQYVLAEETVSLALFARGWAPYEIVDDPQTHGIAFDLLQALMPEDVVTRVEASHKPRGLLRVSEGGVFARLEAIEWIPKEKNLLWTDPIMRMSDALISPADQPVAFNGPSSLEGKTIGCIKNYYYPTIKHIFQEKRATRYDVNKDIILLRMVKAGRVDAVVLDLRTALWLIHTNPDIHLKDFYFSDTPVASVDLRFTFNSAPGWEKRLPEINKRIEQGKKDGTIDTILSHYQ